MTEYIEREKVKEVIKNYGKGAIEDGMKTLDPVDDIILLSSGVDLIPAADVAEVRHGKWIIKNDEKDWRDKDYYRLVIKCSICGKSHFLGTTKYRNEYDEEKLKELGNIGDYSYCGKCGAKMDGKDGSE